jgi:hypothetical protein
MTISRGAHCAPFFEARMNLLTSPRLALVLIVAIAVYSSGAALAGLEHPFIHPLFFCLVAGLFCCTAACTMRRALAMGRMPRMFGELSTIAAESTLERLHVCLSQAGFRHAGTTYRKAAPVLWGGMLLHVGILAIMAGALVNQALSDSGSFEIVEGGQVSLAYPGTVLGRSNGIFVKGAPLPYTIALESFDPYLHQQGYAPDRASRLKIGSPDGATLAAAIDRSHGVTAGDTTIYQAIPFGYALRVSMDAREFAVHLRTTAPKRAEATVTDPSGVLVVFMLETENDLEDPRGTGAIRVGMSRHGGFVWLKPKEPFPFGHGSARIEALARWGGYTYARNPGVAIVFTGFAMLLTGCGMLLMPCGIARIEEKAEGPGRLFLYAPRWEGYFRRRFDEILLSHHDEGVSR